jgi:hypothetical protein
VVSDVSKEHQYGGSRACVSKEGGMEPTSSEDNE